MELEVTTPDGTEVPAQPLADGVRRYMRASAAAATVDAYRADWTCFTAWCAEHGAEPLPAAPGAVAAFLAARADAGDRAATVQRRLAAIAKAHRTAGLEPPTRAAVVKETVKGIRRTLGTAARRKDALVTGRLLALLAATGDDLRGVRDRAVLSLGFVGGLRRSEIVALNVGDLSFVDAGALVTVRRSKTDQEAAGRAVEIAATGTATCPVAALRAWLDAVGVSDGPLFREVDRGGTRLGEGRMSDRAVARAVQRLARAAGVAGDFGGHSLRAGFATSAVAAGVGREAIMRQGGWKSETVMRGYVRAGEAFRTNYAVLLGL